jgi:hypothetical protein
MDTRIYIHGHGCYHNFFTANNTEFNQYQRILLNHSREHDHIVYAIHPLGKDYDQNDFDLVCREFGFELEKVRYEPFYNLTSSQLKEMIPRFKWLEAPWDAITNELAQNSESKTSWYNTKLWPLTDYDWETWLRKTKEWGSMPSDNYGTVVEGEFIPHENITWPKEWPNWNDY